MSGLAAISGEPDGPPMLPPIALTDELTGVVAAFATMVALHSKVGQVVDVNLLETLFQMMGPLISVFKLTGEQQPRLGSQLPYTVPRGVYQCNDGKWVGVSASSDTVAARVIEVLGCAGDQRFLTFAGRVANREELHKLMVNFCSNRDSETVLKIFTDAQAAIGPVLTMAEIAVDPHFAARQAIAIVGATPMQGLFASLSMTPGELRWEGRALDADGAEIRKNFWGSSY
jgi:crotonobetainyl-CoA:carnitine CoA-transferase CaiB-like acyl-CoA transferase